MSHSEKSRWKIVLKVIGNILQVTIKVCLALALFVMTWFYLTPYFRLDRSKEGDYFRNLPSNTLDAIALGSSHMQYAFNPATFYTESGYYSYVMGSPCQPMDMSYYMLEEVLKTQKPEVAFIDVFTLLESSIICYGDGMYYNAIDEMSGETRLKAASVMEEEDKRWQYMFDLIMNHDNWKRIDIRKIKEVIENAEASEGYAYDLGYVRMEPREIKYTPFTTYPVTDPIEPPDKDKAKLDHIIDLCEANSITPVFIKTPYIIDQAGTNQLAGIWSYLRTKNVYIVDYVERAQELGWFFDVDGDEWHNSTWGAEIITRDLAKFVKENQLITNHKEDPVLERLLEGQLEVTAQSLMNSSNVDIYRLLGEAQKYPCYVLLRYKGHTGTSIMEEENNLLHNVGFEKDFVTDYKTDYYAISDNGKLVLESEEPTETTINGHTITLAEDGIQIDGKTYAKAGEMDVYFVGKDFSWVNAVPIDYASRWFWKNECDGYDCTAQLIG